MGRDTSAGLEQLFEKAIALPASERARFIEEACADDPARRSELESLVAASDEAGRFFERLGDVFTSHPPWLVEADDRREETTDPRLGRMVRHYLIEERLSRGRMGVVYRAHDTHLNRTVVLKFLPRRHGEDPGSSERFLVEARAAANLDHPNVCSVYEISEDEKGQPFIVMCYYEGETLKHMLDEGPLPLGEAIDYGLQIARGLEAAHANGIIHRDVKPGNVLVTRDGVAKLLDFGLAKVADVTLTGSDRTLGTVAYMSPEQVRGERVDARTDMWSLGVVLYEMLSGTRPFSGDRTAVVVHSILHARPARLSDLRPDVPPELDLLVAKLVAKRPGRRVHGASALARGLQAIQERSGVDRRGALPPARSSGRRRVAALAGFLAVVLSFWWIFRHTGDNEAALDSTTIRSLAVLPLENLSGDPAQLPFVDAVHHAIIAELAQIGALSVPAAQSMNDYRGKSLSVPVIARELSVDALIEGTVLRIEESVTVSLALIGAVPERHLLTRRFEAPVDSLFGKLADVVLEVAATLDIPLTSRERANLAEPTEVDPEAYDLYARGHESLGRSYLQSDWLAAVELLEQAVAIEPDFAPAHAALAHTHQWLWWLYDRSTERRDRVASSVERALALAPGLPHARIARGWMLLHSEEKPAPALREFQLALRELPNDWEAMFGIAMVKGHQGRFAESVRSLRRTARLNPRSGVVLGALGVHEMFLRDYAAADSTLRRAAAYHPDDPTWPILRAWLAILDVGSEEGTASRLLAEAARARSPEFLLLGAFRDFAPVHVALLPDSVRSDLRRATVDRFAGDSAFYYSVQGLLAERSDESGAIDVARAYYDSALTLLEASAAERADDPSHHRWLAHVYAALDRADPAIRSALRSYELQPTSTWGPWRLDFLAQIYARVGEQELAIDELERLLGEASWVSIESLRTLPVYRPLRGNPRFEALLAARTP